MEEPKLAETAAAVASAAATSIQTALENIIADIEVLKVATANQKRHTDALNFSMTSIIASVRSLEQYKELVECELRKKQQTSESPSSSGQGLSS